MNQSSNPILPGTPQKPKKTRTILIILLVVFSPVIIPIILFILFVIWTSVEGYFEPKIMRHNALQYLQEKYNEEFVVANYRTSSTGLGDPGIGCFDAHPKDDASLQFEFCLSRDNNGYIVDEYISETWRQEERSRLTKLIEREFDDGSVVLNFVRPSVATSFPLYKSIKGKPPVFASIAQEGGYSYVVHVDFYTSDLESRPKELVDAKIVKFLKAVEQVGVEKGIVVAYYRQQETKKAMRTIEVRVEQIYRINSASDVDKHSKERV